MQLRTTRLPGLILATALVATFVTGCSQDGGGLVVYSGRNENLVKPILERFAKDTGIDVKVRYAETSALAPTLLEEGEKTPADVFFSQDAGALAALTAAGLLATLPAELTRDVDARFRDPGGRWVGVTGRARVVAYNTRKLRAAEVPNSVFELTAPEWRGRVGIAPANASFVAFVSALVEQVGRDRTKGWLEGLARNGARRYDNNVLAIDAVAAGEIDVALVNHYYLYAELEERPDAPVANHFPGQQPGGEGTFINVAGVAITKQAQGDADAEAFVRFMLGTEAQTFFREETAEYPLSGRVQALPQLPSLTGLRTIDVPLASLGADLEASVELIKEVGLT